MAELENEGFTGKSLSDAFGGRAPVETPEEPIVDTEPIAGDEPVVTPETGDGEGGEPAGEPTTPTETPPTTFFDEFNKKFSTEFKSDEDFSSLLESNKKLNDYVEKEKVWGGYEVEKKTLQEKIADLEGKLNPRAYFSSDKAYVAEQLRIQRPDLNPDILQEVVVKDIKDMDNFDALVNSELLDGSGLSRKNVEAVLYEKYGIDPDTPREEWDDLAKTKIAIDAKAVKAKFAELQNSISLPEVRTQEQIEQEAALAKEAKVKEITPFVDKFKSFDKFTREIKEGETFEFDVPSDYKDSLEDMFKGFFIEGNLPVNEENLETVVELRDALLLYRNFNKIHEVIEKAAISKHKEATDALLNNTAPENTATNVETKDEREGLPGRGVESFVRSH